jgi:hypothetical protein
VSTGRWYLVIAAFAAATLGGVADARGQTTDPPYQGTVFIDPDMITDADATAYLRTTYVGRLRRSMFDRRVDDFITRRAYVFRSRFNDGPRVEVRVNPEFGSARAAGIRARRYARVVGRLPRALREDLRTMTIHRGDQLFGGGGRDILIHTAQAASYTAEGFLEEALAHEAGHVSLDDDHAAASGWLAAQASDPTFISTYARDNPDSEDVAESFLPWLAVSRLADRLDPADVQAIGDAIPARMEYFEGQGFDLTPLAP